jgi:hypothetical protein
MRHMPGPGGHEITPEDVAAYEHAGLDELVYSYATRTADELVDVLRRAPR